jgi:predicted GTPase
MNVRMADVVVVNKTDAADAATVGFVVTEVHKVNPDALIVRAASPVTLEPGPSLVGRRVLVVEDGPTITHGGMPFGAGTIAAQHLGVAAFADPRPHAVGSIAATFEKYPGIGAVLPAMGYGGTQLEELAATIRATPCDVVVLGTPMDLGRLIDLGHPSRRATYEYRDAGGPSMATVLAPYIAKWRNASRVP